MKKKEMQNENLIINERSKEAALVFPQIFPKKKTPSLFLHQDNIFRAILDQRQNVLAVIPTGRGKSLCYQYPASQLPGLTIVVEPTTALIENQVNSINAAPHCKVRAVKVDRNFLKNKTLRQCLLSRKGQRPIKILYLSPEMLSSPKFIQFARKIVRDAAKQGLPEKSGKPDFPGISMVVVDEAHCLPAWGYSFRESYLSIPYFLKQLSDALEEPSKFQYNRPIVAAFTATATPEMQKDIIEILDLQAGRNCNIETCREEEEKDIRLAIIKCESPEEKFAFLKEWISTYSNLRPGKKDAPKTPETGQGERGIIYCDTVDLTNELYRALIDRGIAVARYHGQLSAEGKKQEYEKFVPKGGEAGERLMVATKAFGLGVNIQDIRYIIHYSIPTSIEDYWQEIGRAGRDGKPCRAVLLYTDEDIERTKNWLSVKDPSIQNFSKNEWKNEEKVEETLKVKLSASRARAVLALIKQMSNLEISNEKIAFGAWESLADKQTDSIRLFVQSYLSSGQAPSGEENSSSKSSDEEEQIQKAKQIVAQHYLFRNNLMVNTTDIARRIRFGLVKGDGFEQRNVISDRKDKEEDAVTTFSLQGNLDYFDMMVADAVYSLDFYGHHVIYISDILNILSGTRTTLLPKMKEQIKDSIERLTKAEISITLPQLTEEEQMLMQILPAERNGLGNTLSGPFLSLEAAQGGGYILLRQMPLYRYAEILNGQIRTIPASALHVVEDKNPIDILYSSLRFEQKKCLHLSITQTVIYEKKQDRKMPDQVKEKRLKASLDRFFAMLGEKTGGSSDRNPYDLFQDCIRQKWNAASVEVLYAALRGEENKDLLEQLHTHFSSSGLPEEMGHFYASFSAQQTWLLQQCLSYNRAKEKTCSMRSNRENLMLRHYIFCRLFAFSEGRSGQSRTISLIKDETKHPGRTNMYDFLGKEIFGGVVPYRELLSNSKEMVKLQDKIGYILNHAVTQGIIFGSSKPKKGSGEVTAGGNWNGWNPVVNQRTGLWQRVDFNFKK